MAMTEVELEQFQKGVKAYYTHQKSGFHPAPMHPPGSAGSAAWQSGFEAARRSYDYLPPETPAWIYAVIQNGPHGGWFTPFEITEGHPLIDGWRCLYCNDPFDAGEGKAFVQPFSPADGPSIWVATHHGCMAQALGLEDLLEMSPIERFYRGRGLDSKGRTFEVSLAMTDDEWESSHKHIQWVFPLPEPSRAQPSSPVMTEADIKVFREDPEIRANIDRALHRFWKFLMETDNWHRERDHNHLRITRVLRFLTLTWFHTRAKDIYEWVETDARCKAPDGTRQFWREALKEKPSFLP